LTKKTKSLDINCVAKVLETQTDYFVKVLKVLPIFLKQRKTHVTQQATSFQNTAQMELLLTLLFAIRV